MNTPRDHDAVIGAWLDDGPQTLPAETRQAIIVGIRTVTRRPATAWPFGRLGLPTFDRPWLSRALGSVAIVVVAALALSFYVVNRQGGIGALPSPTPFASPTVVASPSVEPTAVPSPSPSGTASPSDAEVTELLNSFLEARIAGEGAEEYMLDPSEVPLLYATSSGAPYERAEFEPVLGIEWPYGYTAFKVRLFAGDTVVEQLLFWTAEGPPVLRYDQVGFATHIPPTTENGQPVAVEYNYFHSAVDVFAAHPWVFRSDPYRGGRLIPEGSVAPTTDGAERSDWDELVLMDDPAWVGTDCQTNLDPVGAATLAELIRSDPNVEATAPVAVSGRGFDGLMMDVVITAGASLCMLTADSGSAFDADDPGVLSVVWDRLSEAVVDDGHATGYASGERLRLYLFDVPATTGFQILAVAIVAPESTFERAVEAAAPIVDSVEVHAP